MKMGANVGISLQRIALPICREYQYLIVRLFCHILQALLEVRTSLERAQVLYTALVFTEGFCAMHVFSFLWWAEPRDGVGGEYHLAFHCIVVTGMAKPTQRMLWNQHPPPSHKQNSQELKGAHSQSMNECTAVTFGLVMFSITLLMQQQGTRAMSKSWDTGQSKSPGSWMHHKFPLPGV